MCMLCIVCRVLCVGPAYGRNPHQKPPPPTSPTAGWLNGAWHRNAMGRFTWDWQPIGVDPPVPVWTTCDLFVISFDNVPPTSSMEGEFFCGLQICNTSEIRPSLSFNVLICAISPILCIHFSDKLEKYALHIHCSTPFRTIIPV